MTVSPVLNKQSKLNGRVCKPCISLTFYLSPIFGAVPRGGATWKFLDGVAKLVEAGEPVALARRIEELSEQPLNSKI